MDEVFPYSMIPIP